MDTAFESGESSEWMYKKYAKKLKAAKKNLEAAIKELEAAKKKINAENKEINAAIMELLAARMERNAAKNIIAISNEKLKVGRKALRRMPLGRKLIINGLKSKACKLLLEQEYIPRRIHPHAVQFAQIPTNTSNTTPEAPVENLPLFTHMQDSYGKGFTHDPIFPEQYSDILPDGTCSQSDEHI